MYLLRARVEVGQVVFEDGDDAPLLCKWRKWQRNLSH